MYHFLDDSGDPGLSGVASSSSHFVLAMVQLAERVSLPELVMARQMLHLVPTFEFKYHSANLRQKTIFFEEIQAVPFWVRAVAVDKSSLIARQFTRLEGQDLAVELISQLIYRAEIANDTLIIDGVPSLFLQQLRIRLSERSRQLHRERPFKKIVSSDSKREHGLQLADMIAGAIRHHTMGLRNDYYDTFKTKVTDLWEIKHPHLFSL